ncbi:hypothetical protein A1Q2_08413 [Trichosporon asahii var. asahii CBS 8904]|uniref:Uncharacterized protein n=1 Tax=Trichosporon asahii var. asahii (strain CBS 8904) TaxID=1220162 RepID=K1V978_TRIAC|nr:hypothetical protein A1Q2_08413 [Trichosporon asahii var. asahii CBS 8904]
MVRTLFLALSAQEAAASNVPASTRVGGPVLCSREEVDAASGIEGSSSTPSSDTSDPSVDPSSATSPPSESVNPETDDSLGDSDLTEIPARRCQDSANPADGARSCAADKAPGARVICENLDYVAVCAYCIRGPERKIEMQEGLKNLNDECRNEFRFDVPGVVESGNSIPDPAMKSLRGTLDNASGSSSTSTTGGASSTTSGTSSGKTSGTTSGASPGTPSGNAPKDASGQLRTTSSVLSIAAAGCAALTFVLL